MDRYRLSDYTCPKHPIGIGAQPGTCDRDEHGFCYRCTLIGPHPNATADERRTDSTDRHANPKAERERVNATEP